MITTSFNINKEIHYLQIQHPFDSCVNFVVAGDCRMKVINVSKLDNNLEDHAF